jgi:hypothetical protein
VQFVLGVEQTGVFRFFINVEADIEGPPPAPANKARDVRGGGKVGRAANKTRRGSAENTEGA